MNVPELFYINVDNINRNVENITLSGFKSKQRQKLTKKCSLVTYREYLIIKIVTFETDLQRNQKVRNILSLKYNSFVTTN